MRYQFTLPPADAASLPAYLSGEFARLQQALASPVMLAPTFAAPPKPRDGQLVLAMPPWDPGGGSGFYGYRAGAWRFLG